MLVIAPRMTLPRLHAVSGPKAYPYGTSVTLSTNSFAVSTTFARTVRPMESHFFVAPWPAAAASSGTYMSTSVLVFD